MYAKVLSRVSLWLIEDACRVDQTGSNLLPQDTIVPYGRLFIKMLSAANEKCKGMLDFILACTVEPLNEDLGISHFVLCREVVLYQRCFSIECV